MNIVSQFCGFLKFVKEGGNWVSNSLTPANDWKLYPLLWSNENLWSMQNLAPFGDKWETWRGTTNLSSRSLLHPSRSGGGRSTCTTTSSRKTPGKRRDPPYQRSCDTITQKYPLLDGIWKWMWRLKRSPPHLLINSKAKPIQIAYLAEWRFAIWDISNQLRPIRRVFQQPLLQLLHPKPHWALYHLPDSSLSDHATHVLFGSKQLHLSILYANDFSKPIHHDLAPSWALNTSSAFCWSSILGDDDASPESQLSQS